MHFDTELKNYYLIKFEHNGVVIDSIEIIWGIIKSDKKRSFKEGDYICTTNIVEKFESENNKYIRTTNTVYKVNNLIDNVILATEISIINALRAGVSPDEIKFFEKNDMKIVSYE